MDTLKTPVVGKGLKVEFAHWSRPITGCQTLGPLSERSIPYGHIVILEQAIR